MSTAPDTVELRDPKAIRAIAHPARMVVIDALYDQGRELTATQAAELAGITPSAMSYHLRALERFGIVKRATSSDGRERPWVRAARDLAIRPSTTGHSTALTAATGAVLASAMDTDRERLMGSMRRLSAEKGRLPLDPVAGFRRTWLLVTPDEAVELMRQIDELVSPLRLEERRDARPAAGRLMLTITSIPDPDNPGAPAPTEQES
jgi:DNA-binding transcriptional ArsR family regulator